MGFVENIMLVVIVVKMKLQAIDLIKDIPEMEKNLIPRWLLGKKITEYANYAILRIYFEILYINSKFLKVFISFGQISSDNFYQNNSRLSQLNNSTLL